MFSLAAIRSITQCLKMYRCASRRFVCTVTRGNLREKERLARMNENRNRRIEKDDSLPQQGHAQCEITFGAGAADIDEPGFGGVDTNVLSSVCGFEFRKS